MYEHLKELRESLGLTQSEFGKSVGIAKSTYNNYETGIRDPKSDFWIAVAQKYGVTIDYLMGYSDNPHPFSLDAKKFPVPAEASTGNASLDVENKNIKELKSIYNSLNETGKTQLMIQARQIANFDEYISAPRQSKHA